MLKPRTINRSRFLSIVFIIFSFFGFQNSSVAAATAGSFYQAIQALSSGSKELSIDARVKLEASTYDPREGLAGVKLGMSMEEVIAVWGLPKRICMQSSAILLTIGIGSQFSFVNNELVSIKILSTDLPAMSLSNGVDFSSSPSQLSSLYAITNPRGNSYVTDITEGIELQFYYYNRGGKGLKMITMGIVGKL